jgi:hypothetical protein
MTIFNRDFHNLRLIRHCFAADCVGQPGSNFSCIFSCDGLTGDGLSGDGLTGDGLTGDRLTGDGLPGDGLTGDGLTGDGLTGDGPNFQ